MNVSSALAKPFLIDSMVKFNKVFILDQASLEAFIEAGNARPGTKCNTYCMDALNLLHISNEVIIQKDESMLEDDGIKRSRIVFFTIFGDTFARSQNIPIIAKYRMISMNKREPGYH